jgi:hypothetical protein
MAPSSLSPGKNGETSMIVKINQGGDLSCGFHPALTKLSSDENKNLV